MKKFLSLFMAVVVVSAFAFFAIASGSDSNETVEQESGAVAGSSDSNNSLGDYEVEIKNARMTKDYEGKAVVVITYGYTNNSENPTSFSVAFEDNAFQDGVGLEKCYFVDDSDPYDSANQDKQIKKGVSLDVDVAYVLNDSTTAVDVEVKEFISFNDKTIKKTFEIK